MDDYVQDILIQWGLPDLRQRFRGKWRKNVIFIDLHINSAAVLMCLFFLACRHRGTSEQIGVSVFE